jgi:hypothetical protein
MKVAVAAAHQAEAAACLEEGSQCRKCGKRLMFELVDCFLGKQIWVRFESRGVVSYETSERIDPDIGFDRFGALMHCGDRNRKTAQQVVLKFAALGETIECQILLETSHFHGPFDRLAGAIEGERPVLLAHDRHEATIKLRREGSIDFQFSAAGGLAFFER